MNEALDKALWLLTRFDGRVGRRFLWGHLGITIGIFSIFGLGVEYGYLPRMNLSGVRLLFFWAIAILPFQIATICITVKRFHDLNLNGWYLLILLIPGINLIMLAYALLAPGTNGPNNTEYQWGFLGFAVHSNQFVALNPS